MTAEGTQDGAAGIQANVGCSPGSNSCEVRTAAGWWEPAAGGGVDACAALGST